MNKEVRSQESGVREEGRRKFLLSPAPRSLSVTEVLLPCSPASSRWWLIACSCWIFISPVFQDSAFAKNSTPKTVNPEISNSCSEQSLKTLMPQLMLDLPSYTNRVIQRARSLNRSVDTFSYILVAGRPEFQSLPLNPGIDNENKYEAEGVKQVFFTTLERKYINKKPVELQEFHRLFLTKTNIGWAVVMMFSQTGEYPVKPPIAPPRDSSNGAIAQGVKLWLRDCEAGSVKLPSN